MTSIRQIEANRRNALKSTGPKTEEGKSQSRRNAVRHGLTAETVIGVLEDVDDYMAFEAAVVADYDATSVQWSENWFCGSRASCGGCGAPPQWRPDCSSFRSISSGNARRRIEQKQSLGELFMRNLDKRRGWPKTSDRVQVAKEPRL